MPHVFAGTNAKGGCGKSTVILNLAQSAAPQVENHSRAAAPRERPESADRHFAVVRAAYEKATGNRWKKPDSDAYEENGLRKLPAETVTSAIEAVAQRTSVKINSFRHFIQELVALPDPGNPVRRKKQLEKLSGEFGITPSAAPTIRRGTSSKMSSARAPGKPFPLTTTALRKGRIPGTGNTPVAS